MYHLLIMIAVNRILVVMHLLLYSPNSVSGTLIRQCPILCDGYGTDRLCDRRSGPLAAFTVSFTVTGVTPAPAIVAVFVMEASAASGA